MNKKRILLVHNYYQVPGGEDTVVLNEKKMLEDNGHEVFIYTRNNDEIKRMNILGKLKLAIETIYSLKTIIEIKKVIKENRIDIVHVHNTFPLISPSIYKAAKECGVKVVQTIHNFRLLCPSATFTCKGKICEKCMNDGLRFSIKNKCYRSSTIQTLIIVLMLKVNKIIGSYDKVDAYIALTNFNKNKLQHLIPNEKIFVKSNFVDINKEIIPFEKRKNQFVFVGRLDKLKGIDLLLKAWKGIKDSDLIIFGTGPEEEWCKNYIKENNLLNVKLMGFVSNEKVKKIITYSKALILPSQWYEGFPMTIVEAYSVGTPVIGSNIGNIGDLIIHNKSGWKFKPNCTDSLIKAVKEVSDCTESTYNLYREHYNAEKNYKILVSIYEEIQ